MNIFMLSVTVDKIFPEKSDLSVECSSIFQRFLCYLFGIYVFYNNFYYVTRDGLVVG